jgi:hypothetical protein
MAELTPSDKARRTQWAAQLLAAAELVRRGYTVAFTMGNNAPIADLMVGTPSGQFWVDVKGLSAKGAWLVKPKRYRENLFYILVLLSPLAEPGQPRQPDEFFVLTQDQANDAVKAYYRDHSNQKPGKPGDRPGFVYSNAVDFKDRWDTLPPAIHDLFKISAA